MAKKLTDGQYAEVEQLQRADRGVLYDYKVLAKAQEPTSELHKHEAFLFDDEPRALREFWLGKAREIIGVFYEITPWVDPDGDGTRQVRRVVTNAAVRSEYGAGAYISQAYVVNNQYMREAHVQEALNRARGMYMSFGKDPDLRAAIDQFVLELEGIKASMLEELTA